MPAKPINVKIHTEGNSYDLAGIPQSAWDAYDKHIRKHFPDSGDNAWAAGITEMILSVATHTSYFLTGVPEANSRAMDETLAKVNWTWDAFHAYLLHAVVIPGAVRMVAYHEPKIDGKEAPQQFGTLIITGLRKSTYDKLEKATGKSIQEVMGAMFNAFERGDITFTPADYFTKVSED